MVDFFFLLIFLFGIAIFLRMDWIYYLIYVVGGVWLFSHWWVRRSLGKITVSRRLNPKAFTGEDVDVEIVVTNKSRLPVPWLRIHESAPIELQSSDSYKTVLSVGGRSQAQHTFRLHCQRRGYYDVGPLRLYTGDLFGFAESAWQESNPTHLTVYPQVLTLPQLGLPSQLPFGTVKTRQRIFEDPTRIGGVRPYDSGDSMRHIHWRASAHENTLLVKKFQPSIALDTTVVLDLNDEAFPSRERYSGSEWAIVIAASLVSHLAENRQAVGLFSNGWDPFSEHEVQPIHSQTGRGHLMAILDILARIQLRKSPPENGTEAAADHPNVAIESWLLNHATSLTWGTTLIVVTPRLSEALIWSLHSLYRRGITVLVLVCVHHADFKEAHARAEALGITAYEVIWESDLSRLQQAPVAGV
ncbi:MAG: DUF58 domain-containing protein [Caldilineaceae bacterium]|nr:DUF58 domain-containing protein [Caldilineaceae bacterium]